MFHIFQNIDDEVLLQEPQFLQRTFPSKKQLRYTLDVMVDKKNVEKREKKEMEKSMKKEEGKEEGKEEDHYRLDELIRSIRMVVGSYQRIALIVLTKQTTWFMNKIEVYLVEQSCNS